MKSQKFIYPLIILGFILISAIGCKKADSDYASEIAGTYNGTVTVVGTGTVSGSSTLNKSADAVVDLVITLGSSSTHLNGISISSSGSNYSLSYSDASGSFSGQVSGNKLTWTMTAGSGTDTFSGTK